MCVWQLLSASLRSSMTEGTTTTTTIMPNPTLTKECGLKYLSKVDQLMVQKETQHLVVTPPMARINSQYTIDDQVGQVAFQAAEHGTFYCSAFMDYLARPCELFVHTPSGHRVFWMQRQFNSRDRVWAPEVRVLGNDGRLLGTILEEGRICAAAYTLLDHQGNELFRIEGPTWHCPWMQDAEYDVISAAKSTDVGAITHHQTPHEDKFGVSFPLDLTRELKAVYTT